MILYHGTSEKYLESILSRGILPREKTNNSNWSGLIESKQGYVYLTNTYPVYFALASCREKENLLIVKVDLSEKKLYPDEDFIAYVLKHKNDYFKKMNLREINQYVCLVEHKKNWKDSLKYNGLVSCKEIRKKEIIDYVVIDKKEVNLIMSIGGDSMPIPINYMIMGETYQGYIDLLFEKGIEYLKTEIRKNYENIQEKLGIKGGINHENY